MDDWRLVLCESLETDAKAYVEEEEEEEEEEEVEVVVVARRRGGGELCHVDCIATRRVIQREVQEN